MFYTVCRIVSLSGAPYQMAMLSNAKDLLFPFLSSPTRSGIQGLFPHPALSKRERVKYKRQRRWIPANYLRE